MLPEAAPFWQKFSSVQCQKKQNKQTLLHAAGEIIYILLHTKHEDLNMDQSDGDDTNVIEIKRNKIQHIAVYFATATVRVLRKKKKNGGIAFGKLAPFLYLKWVLSNCNTRNEGSRKARKLDLSYSPGLLCRAKTVLMSSVWIRWISDLTKMSLKMQSYLNSHLALSPALIISA